MSAKKPAGKTDAPFRRGTGGPGGTPLKEYAKPGKAGDFGRDLIEKLTGPGLNEAEYIQIAKKHGKSEKRFETYIEYYRDQGFNIVELSNGCYVDKTEASNASVSSTQTQATLNGEVPTKEEIKKILGGIVPKGKEIDEEALKCAIELSFATDKRTLKAGWWEETKRNLIEWSKKG